MNPLLEPLDEFARRPFVTDSTARSMSLDSRDDFHTPQEPSPYEQKISPYPKSSPGDQKTMGYHRRYAPVYRRLPSRNLQSVVTSSFSIEEERDGLQRGFPASHARDNTAESRSDSDERHHDGEDRDGWGIVSPAAESYYVQTPSPKIGSSINRAQIHRSYSTSGYFAQSDTMKRSYYHHSFPSNHQYQGQLPPEFMPPTKRTRIKPVTKEIAVSPHGDGHPMLSYGHVVHRAQSFPAPSSWAATQYFSPTSAHNPHQSPNHHVPSPATFMGPYHGAPTKKLAQVSPASDVDESPWRGEHPPWGHSPYSRHGSSHFWESPRHGEMEGSVMSPRKMVSYAEAGFSPRSKSLGERKGPPLNTAGDEKMRMMVEAAAAATSALHASSPANLPKQLCNSEIGMRLSLPNDKISLSETLCVVRENIEVFTATQRDVDAPAPGRKHAVVVGQVGLRCIHCRHTLRCSDRVKRAVCYPSSIKRIYRTVIDMKLDHFSQCKFVPSVLKNHLSNLKAIHTRSTGTTMQYFIEAAYSLGMKDGPSGVLLEASMMPKSTSTQMIMSKPREDSAPLDKSSSATVARCDSLSSVSWTSGHMEVSPKEEVMPSWSFDNPAFSGAKHNATNTSTQGFAGKIPLALSEDKTALSPLRCFLREQVCAYSATENDIAVRAPTTFSITVGQVGIGCVHCLKLPARYRSNRAVCFPFSIGRIYQSVADIQRFHFGECKEMPSEVKDVFLELQGASSKGSKGLATRQYWVTSAKKIGLVDTPTGIRFGRDPTKPELSAAFSLDILAQVAFSVTTASKPLVTVEDRSCIAEFLYLVMEQLQPCRFTEADRNKRRLKDVGCIGVECKHCAGQVDSRKFFWSSVSAVESNFVSVHTHVLECKSLPESLRGRLIELKQLRKEQTAALKTGSQKSFFARVWQRLHDSELSDDEGMPSEQFRELASVPIEDSQAYKEKPYKEQGDVGVTPESVPI